VADIHANLIGSLNVMTGALAAGATRFVYVTTGGALYGQPIEVPCGENHPIAPLSPYGWTKYLVERYLDFLHSSTMSWVALRLANVYGPRQRADGEAGVVARFAGAMARGLPITIDGDGGQARDFVYVADVVSAVMAAIESDATGPINIGTERGTSVNSLFGVMSSISGYDQPPAYGPPRPGDIYTSVLACERARTELAWTARTTLESGLQETFAALTS
jgi:Nucleoside-diphosphate-sugar epimerases